MVAIIDEGQGHLPKWLENLRKEKGDQYKKIMSMISIGEELKTKLGKLRTPYAMRELSEIHRRYADILSDKAPEKSISTSSTSTASSSSSIPQLDRPNSSQDPADSVLSFLSNIEETKGGTAK